MAYFRLYFLDRSNHIEHFHEFEALTDDAAVAQSEEWRGAEAMELWSGRRRVRSWEAFARSPEGIARSAVRTLRLAS